MTLKGKSTITRHQKAKTLYLTIPSMIAQDSQFSFKVGEPVSIVWHPEIETLTITKSSEKP